MNSTIFVSILISNELYEINEIENYIIKCIFIFLNS